MPTIITKGAMSVQPFGFGNAPIPIGGGYWILILDYDGDGELTFSPGGNFGVHVLNNGDSVFTYLGPDGQIRYNKVSNEGEIIWQKELSVGLANLNITGGNRTSYGSPNGKARPFGSAMSGDNTYLIYTEENSTQTGPSDYASNYILAKMDISGNLIWGNGINEYLSPDVPYTYLDFQAMFTTSANGSHIYSIGYFYELGHVNNYTIQGIVIHKFDPVAGSFTYTNAYVGDYYDDPITDFGYFVDGVYPVKSAVANDGTLYICGVIQNQNGGIYPGVSGLANQGDDAYFLAKFDTTGSNLIWTKLIAYTPTGGTNFTFVGAVDIKLDSNGNIITTGAYNTGGNNLNTFMAKLDSDGNLLFAKTIATYKYWPGPPASPFITTDSSNNIYIGFTDADFNLQIHCYDSSGNYIWSNLLYSPEYTYLKIRDMRLGGVDNALYINIGNTDYYVDLLLKLPSDGSGQGNYNINNLFTVSYETVVNNIANTSVNIANYSTITNRNTVPFIDHDVISTNFLTGSQVPSDTVFTSSTIPI